LVLIAPRWSFVARPFRPSSLPAAFRQKRRDLEAAALDFPTSRPIGFDGAALVFCQPADFPKYLRGTVSEAKTIEKRKIH
jgi:hypothetical protein